MAFGAKSAAPVSAREKNLYALIREQGFYSMTGDRLAGVAGISAPVFRADNSVAAALTLTMPAERYDARHVQKVLQAARSLTGLL